MTHGEIQNLDGFFRMAGAGEREVAGCGKQRRGRPLVLAILCVLFAAVSSMAADGEYIHYKLAVQFKNEKKYGEAIEEFRKVLAVYPDHYNSYMQLAQIYAAQGNHKLVIYNLQRALVYNPGWTKAQLMLAEAFAADGQFDKAVREYQVYQNGCDPRERDSIQTVINGLMNRMRGAPPAVGPSQKTAAETAHTTHGPAHAAHGTTQASAQKTQQAAAIKLDPRAEEAMKKVLALYEQNRFDDMLAAVKEVLAIQPNHPGAYYYAGLVRMKNGQKDMAKINFRKALAHPVYGPAANFYLGVILGEEGMKSDAVKHLRAGLASSADNFDRNEAARLIELYSGQTVPASAVQPQTASAAAAGAEPQPVPLEKYDPIEIRIDSMLSMMTVDTITDAGQKLLAAIRAFAAGRYDDALREFKRVQAENPNAPIAAHCLYNAGICYYRLRLYKDAENQFQLFLDRFPNHRFAPRAAFFKASCYQERGDYAVSERLFRQFIQNNRNHEWVGRAYERLGDSYADMEDHKKAIDAYNQALASRGATPMDRVILNYKLGNSCAMLSDNNRAMTFFNAAIDMGEKSGVYVRVPDCYYKIADLKFKQKDFTSALDYYKRVTRKYPAFQETPWGLFQIAGAHRNLKQYREAVDTYRELMQKFPDDYWAKQAQWRMEDTIWEHEFKAVKK